MDNETDFFSFLHRPRHTSKTGPKGFGKAERLWSKDQGTAGSPRNPKILRAKGVSPASYAFGFVQQGDAPPPWRLIFKLQAPPPALAVGASRDGVDTIAAEKIMQKNQNLTAVLFKGPDMTDVVGEASLKGGRVRLIVTVAPIHLEDRLVLRVRGQGDDARRT